MDVAARLKVKYARELRSDTPEGLFPGEDQQLDIDLLPEQRTRYFSLVVLIPEDQREYLRYLARRSTHAWMSNTFLLQEPRHFHLTISGDLKRKKIYEGLSEEDIVQDLADILRRWRSSLGREPELKIRLTKCTISKASINCEIIANDDLLGLYEQLHVKSGVTRALNDQSVSLVRFLLNTEQGAAIKDHHRDVLKNQVLQLNEERGVSYEINEEIHITKFLVVECDRIAEYWQVKAELLV